MKKTFAVLTLSLMLSGVIQNLGHAAVIATVNKKQLTDDDLKAALAQFNEGQRTNILKDPNNRRQVLMSMIDQELLNQEAERQKLGEDPQITTMVENFRKQQMMNRLLEKNLSSQITSASAKKFYEQNKLLFNTDQVHAQHILVATDVDAREILKKVKEPKADFQKIAEQSSRDPSAKNNRGDLGFFARDQFDQDFTKAAFGGSAGEILGPVKTAYGYHIIKVLEKKAGKTLPFEEVEAKATGFLRQKLGKEYLSKLRDQAKIQVEDKVLDKM